MCRSVRLIVILSVFALPSLARACPFCADSVPQQSNGEAEDAKREAEAYNNSIYLMAGTPFLLVGCVGTWVYRSLKRKAAADAAAAQEVAQEGGCPWSLSHADSSSPLPPLPPEA